MPGPYTHQPETERTVERPRHQSFLSVEGVFKTFRNEPAHVASAARVDVNANADAAFNSFNTSFLVSSGSTQYYKEAPNVQGKDYFWRQGHVRNNKTSGGILTNGQRQRTWQSEFVRGLGEFVRDNNLWSTYYGWMKQNADAGGAGGAQIACVNVAGANPANGTRCVLWQESNTDNERFLLSAPL